MCSSWKRCALPAIAGLLLSAGCRTYEPAPLALPAYGQAWLARSLADHEGLLDYAARLTVVGAGEPDAALAFDPADGLTLLEAEVVALFFNPELRLARASARVPLVGSRHAGLWEDPTLDVDVTRILATVSEPWLAGGALGFTIPLSGRLPVERDLAWAEYGSAWRGVAVDEWETLAALRASWFEWSARRQGLGLLRGYLDQLEEILATAEQLASRGELNPSDARVFRIARAESRAELMGLEADVEELRLGLLAMLGLNPAATIALEPTLSVPVTPAAPDDMPSPLMQHPELQLAAAEYEVAEQQLRREITKQFPDLTFGPAYENEEGQSRIGLGLGVPVPVLNRNRRGIAEAEASRDAARARAEHTYERLVHRLYRARVGLAAAETLRSELARHLAPIVEEQIREIRRLADLGELNVLLLQDALSSLLAGKLTVLDTRLAEASSRSELDSLLHPRWIIRPEPRKGDEETLDE